jgi:hypothetical protein
MRDIKSQKYPAYFTYELFMSNAFRHLRPSAKDILIQVYYEISFSSNRNRSKKYVPVITNRHDIRLSYQEIGKRLGYKEKAIWAAFRQFMAHGFLKVIKHGGGSKGDYNVYGITEDWRKWNPGQVIREIKRNGKSGWQRSKKISSPTGKPLHSPTGKQPKAETGSGFPTGKSVCA